MTRAGDGAGLARLPRESKGEAVRLLQAYLRDEMDHDAGELATELLLDFVAEMVGPFYYNEALSDARRVAADRAATTDEEIFALERSLAHLKRGLTGER